MIVYLVNQMVIGKLTYDEVASKRPDLKSAIDQYINENSITLGTTA
jgi:hypothetical protein